jgi:hypothetical protein
MCAGCTRPILDKMDRIRCEVTGDVLCRECHSACTSLACARENGAADGADVCFDALF